MIKDNKMPEIDEFYFYIHAFHELETCRNGISLSPIPFTAISEFAKIYEVEDFDDFLYFIRVMDNKFLSLKEEKNAKHRSKDDSGNK